MRIAVIGATGVLGREVVASLRDQADSEESVLGGAPPSLFSTGKNAGDTFEWGADEELVAEAYQPDSARGMDAVVLAVPASAVPEIAGRLRELGIPAVDASRANRAVAPFYFDEAPRPARLIGAPLVALPSAESLALSRICVALQSLNPKSIRATIIKAASAAGTAGLADLAEGTGKLLNGNEPETPLHGHRLAFNLVPQSGAFTGADTEAELDLARDLPALTDRSIAIASTVAWGPWFYGDVFSLAMRFDSDVSVGGVRALLTGRPHLKLVDDPETSVYPMPALATGDDAVLVGRVRRDPLDPRGLQLVAVQDGARAAASHAVAALGAVLRAKTAH